MSRPTTSLPGPHNIQRAVLANGVVVLVYENFAAQSSVIAGSVRVGSLYEMPDQNGLASLTASALMRGGSKRDFDAINTALEEAGADLNINAGVHRTSFYAKSLAEDLPLLVDVLADVLRRPTFPPVQVERLRGEIITSLQIRYQDTRYRANRAFSEALYPADHAYHYSTRGSLASVPQITRDQLEAFHRAHYGPDGMIVVVVGAVNAQQAIETIRAQFEDWTNPAQPEPPTLPDLPALSENRRSEVMLPGKTQSDLVMGVPGPSRFAPDYQAAVLANSILGQFGMMGRIGASVREELGLAYYAYSQVDGGFGPGPWSVTAGVNPANLDLAVSRITDELRRLTSEPVSDEDLADNQAFYSGRLPLQLESNEGIASALLNIETYQLGLDYLLKYRDVIYSLTKDDLMAAAQRYLSPEALVIGVAGPARKAGG